MEAVAHTVSGILFATMMSFTDLVLSVSWRGKVRITVSSLE